jgi:hypothetical protein
MIGIVTMASGGRLKPGYYLVQSIPTYERPEYSALSVDNGSAFPFHTADSLFAALREHAVDGIESYPLWYDSVNIAVRQQIAARARLHGIDIWESDWQLLKNAQKGAFGRIRPELAASALDHDGTISPLVDEKERFFPDVLNPDCVSWLLDVHRKGSYGWYLSRMVGSINGYFLDETRLTNNTKASSTSRPPPWTLPVFSGALLAQWRDYCSARRLTNAAGEIMNAFPVPDRGMVAAGRGITQYVPGFARHELTGSTRFGDHPADSTIWKEWYAFLAQSFNKQWISPLVHLVDSLNRNTKAWRGICYFQLFPWAIDARDARMRDARLPRSPRWGAWARDFGVDLRMLTAVEGLDYFMCETYPPLDETLKEFVKAFKAIVDSGGKEFGLMLHRDDSWPLHQDEEARRWAFMDSMNPVLIGRYPLRLLLPSTATGLPWSSANHSEDREREFLRSLRRYRE